MLFMRDKHAPLTHSLCKHRELMLTPSPISISPGSGHLFCVNLPIADLSSSTLRGRITAGNIKLLQCIGSRIIIRDSVERVYVDSTIERVVGVDVPAARGGKRDLNRTE